MSCPRRTGCGQQTVTYQYYYTTQPQNTCTAQVQWQVPQNDITSSSCSTGNGYIWVPTNIGSCGELESRGIVAGSDSNGNPIYIGRAKYYRELLPCKIIPGSKTASVGYGLAEILVNDFEMYCKPAELEWVSASDGEVPPGAIPFGKTSTDEILYVGRVHHEDSLTPGKIHPLHKCCYIPYDCKEFSFNEYEVLVEK